MAPMIALIIANMHDFPPGVLMAMGKVFKVVVKFGLISVFFLRATQSTAERQIPAIIIVVGQFLHFTTYIMYL